MKKIERIIFQETLNFVEGESILFNLNILKTYFVNWRDIVLNNIW